MQTVQEFVITFREHADEDPQWRALLYFDKYDDAIRWLNDIPLMGDFIRLRPQMECRYHNGAQIIIRFGDRPETLNGAIFNQLGVDQTVEDDIVLRLEPRIRRTNPMQDVLPLERIVP